MNLPLDSSPCFYKENKVFFKKKNSNLVFGDDFDFIGIISMSGEIFHVLGEKWHQTLLLRTRERLSSSP